MQEEYVCISDNEVEDWSPDFLKKVLSIFKKDYGVYVDEMLQK
ncbi:hypothetical protein THOM_2339 [Trachipleistophora hominis]|uniref:Uncharacterized protein n=1 Tax=Trachipleistophora hominis TaxID=72359 RepID=L7JUN3_TRAHO|nr:hypothetical protein THOM_2339 [Trachipleistophora hominis]